MHNLIENPGPATVPAFISAKTPDALRVAMFRNNLKLKGFVVYRDIQYVEKDKLWFAWYDAPIDFVPLRREGKVVND